MRDRVFARMLEILLSEKQISVSVTDKKETRIPEGSALVITDLHCADKDVQRFENTVYICGRDETEPEGRVCLRRPFLIDAFISEILDTLFSDKKADSDTLSLSLDKKTKSARYGKLAIPLTETEFKLLLLLYENKGETVTCEEITDKVFGGKTVENSNVSAVYVNYLRKKLDERIGKRMIFSVRGKGYTLKI